MKPRVYIAIDLKSFYASVECVERKLDPLTTNLVVADASRTEKTICLAVSPSMKSYGLPGRARLFEVVARVAEVNRERLRAAPGRRLTGSSINQVELEQNPSLALEYLVAPPRMAFYMEYSTKIYQVYLKYIAPEDIHVYSIDEVFIDATHYLEVYRLTARELAVRMIRDVLAATGITATAGIGTNLYLCKIAMDIVAKHVPADQDGVRIAELDEQTYRQTLWSHRPLTDFWRVGRGYAKKLADNGLYTMGDIARCSLGKAPAFHSEDLLYRLFGVGAELLIDHAWGWEPCTIADIKAYKPASSSISSGQVLPCAYSFDRARLIIREMTDALVLELVEKRLVTDQLVLDIGYDVENLADGTEYTGRVETDFYGRRVPKAAHGSANLGALTSSTKKIVEAAMTLYDSIVNRRLTVRRMHVTAAHIVGEDEAERRSAPVQLDLFTDYRVLEEREAREAEERAREKKVQHVILAIKNRYGKNAILKGMSFEEGATAKERNEQIGGHKS